MQDRVRNWERTQLIYMHWGGVVPALTIVAPETISGACHALS